MPSTGDSEMGRGSWSAHVKRTMAESLRVKNCKARYEPLATADRISTLRRQAFFCFNNSNYIRLRAHSVVIKLDLLIICCSEEKTL